MATDGTEFKRLTREQFGMAISLLGLKKSEDQVRRMFERKELKLADLLTKELFVRRVECFRRDNISDEKREMIPSWFSDMYSLMCEDDSQIDESTGQRYILTSQLRSVLTDYGNKISSEEADMIIRECHPKPDEDAPLDQALMRIYFGQYQAMLIDEGV
jgi:Ca2+-binding EF-hand superfamily protein